MKLHSPSTSSLLKHQQTLGLWISRVPQFGKMALLELTGTIDYLTNAAHLLHTSSPQISAHLMSQRSSILSTFAISISDNQRQHVCSACGHIMIAYQETLLKVETSRAIRKRRGKKSASAAERATIEQPPTKAKVIQCGNCQRTTKIQLPHPGPAKRHKARIQPVAKKAAVAAEPPKATANATSKKRAKNRKAGLQALLSGQQQAANPLSLANFMKK